MPYSETAKRHFHHAATAVSTSVTAQNTASRLVEPLWLTVGHVNLHSSNLLAIRLVSQHVNRVQAHSVYLANPASCQEPADPWTWTPRLGSLLARGAFRLLLSKSDIGHFTSERTEIWPGTQDKLPLWTASGHLVEQLVIGCSSVLILRGTAESHKASSRACHRHGSKRAKIPGKY